MQRHTKLIKTYLKPLKGDQRKNFTQKNCKSLKVLRKKQSVMKEYLQSAPQNPQLFQLKLLSIKLTFLIQKIADEFNRFFTNIGTDLANKIPNAPKRFDFYITERCFFLT